MQVKRPEISMATLLMMHKPQQTELSKGLLEPLKFSRMLLSDRYQVSRVHPDRA